MAAPDRSSRSENGPVASARALLVLAGLVGLQGAALLVAGAFYAVEIALGRQDELRGALFVLVCAVFAGLALLLVGRAIRRERRWSGSPTLLTQLLALPVALSLAGSERWYVGVLLLAWVSAVLGLLFAGPVRARLWR